MARGARFYAKKRKQALKKDNLAEDRIIKSLEKKLKINKKKTKGVPKSFMEDGLDYILEICDEDTRKLAAESEKRLKLDLNDESDDSDQSDVEPKMSEKKKVDNKKDSDVKSSKLKKSQKESSLDSENEVDSDHDREVAKKSKKSKNKVEKSKGQAKSAQSGKSDSQDGKNKANKSSEKKRNSKNNDSALPTKKRKLNNKDVSEDVPSDNESIFDSEDEADCYDGSDGETAYDSGASEDSDVGYAYDSTDEAGLNDESDEGTAFDSEDKEEGSTLTDGEDTKSDKNTTSKVKAKLGKSDLKEDEEEGVWEDIYGRKRNKDGEIVTQKAQKYVAPARRLKDLGDNPEKSQKLLHLRRQLKGFLNRLAESNMHAIISQLDELYMSNSRNDMNELLSSLMIESIVAPVLTAERLVAEHMMTIAILHANIGTEIGAHFIMVLIKKFSEMIEQPQEVENKELDNLVLMICQLYNFKVFGSQLIYQILEKLLNKFTEKEIEIILLILKATGFLLRKDDPLALKEIILNLQQKATSVKSSNTRIQFMLDVLLAIKNNNMSKIPQYDQSVVEHLRKIIKTLIRKGNTVSQLNLSLQDLLNADESGKWWIVGSAWAGKALPSNKPTKGSDDKPAYSQKILKLAQAQRMNTDVRKNIFCILMTAEDYLDAFEKLHHLGLKDRQEREIIYVILNCCLQEQNYNPYYAVLLQKFCEYDRKYQMTIQYTLWDKLKMLDTFKSDQILNMAKLMSHLFIQMALPLSIMKVVNFGELDKASMKLFKKVMLEILLHENTETCLQVFERIATSAKLHQFREGLRLFVNYFLNKNIKKEKLTEKQTDQLQKRVNLVDQILLASTSKISF